MTIFGVMIDSFIFLAAWFFKLLTNLIFIPCIHEFLEDTRMKLKVVKKI